MAKKFDFRNMTVFIGAALGFSLLVGRPFFAAWFKPYALPLAFLVVIGMFGMVAIQNKISIGRAFPGQRNVHVVRKSRVAVLILICVILVANFLFHLMYG
ncbi:hypothetical protein [Mesorhizobium sp. NFR06]|uniref:hypothetical protein n=1 Tax=Mesorhizobium sp. NFR06 TaxID=1566290 RepID=UPI00122D6F11|nr:hypothetical protein [Mesorhizobium sp. NFR06]